MYTVFLVIRFVSGTQVAMHLLVSLSRTNKVSYKFYTLCSQITEPYFSSLYICVAGAITMAIDEYSRYLATGDGDGFVKVWNISEYCVSTSVDEPPLTKQPRE
jgi:hypothetical protein